MKRIVALALVLTMVFALAACGAGGGAKPGTYTLTKMIADGEDYTSMLGMLGMEITMVLEKDGTGYMDMYGEKMDITWDAKNITLDGDAQAYTVDGDEITMTEGDTSMTFTLKK